MFVFFLGKSFSSNTMIPTDRRIPIPDISRLSASSAAAVAAMGPKIDKLKQWSRQTYKCTKQSIYEILGKTTRTVDIELDTQIEVLKKPNQNFLVFFLFSNFKKQNVNMNIFLP